MSTATKSQAEGFAFYEGRPIGRFDEDDLGRKPFARFFAEAITRHHGNEGLVLAVNAPWGEGKTSFKNMVTDLLKQEHGDRVVTLSFTPWEWSSQNQVSEAFFGEIAKQLELADSSKEAKDAADRFRSLGRYLGLTGRIAGPSGMFLEPLLPGSTLVTMALGKGLSKATELAESAADQMEQAAKDAKEALPAVQKRLRQALEKYGREKKKLILVVIDDIDRLSPEEIRLVFQMVRVNGDFPALVYLLLYDEKFVVSALEEFFGEASQRFLEKIVQFQTALPVLVDCRLRDHVERELRRIFDTRPAYRALLDEERFRSLWTMGVCHYITNLRQAGRLLGALEFHLGVFRSEEAEVNPIDFLVVEVLHLFERDLHRSLFARGDSLFPTFQERVVWQSGREGDNPWSRRIDEFANDANEVNRRAARALLANLFPNPVEDETEAVRLRRICSIYYFNRYFRLTVDAGDVADVEIKALVRSLNEPEQFVRLVEAFQSGGRLSLALKKLLVRDGLEPSTKPAELIGRLCDFADQVANSEGAATLLSALQKVVELQLPDSLSPQECFDLVSNGVSRARSFHFAVRVAKAMDGAERMWAKAEPHQRLHIKSRFDRDGANRLNQQVAERIESAVSENRADFSRAWSHSIRWYLEFMRARSQAFSTRLLATPVMVAVVLRAIIDEQAFEEYNQRFPTANGFFASTPMILSKQSLSFDSLDAAINQHEAQLREMGELVSKRVDIYRNMRQHHSHLADPQTNVVA